MTHTERTLVVRYLVGYIRSHHGRGVAGIGRREPRAAHEYLVRWPGERASARPPGHSHAPLGSLSEAGHIGAGPCRPCSRPGEPAARKVFRMEYTRLGRYGPDGEPDRAGLHELRPGRVRHAPVDAGRGRRGAVLPAGRRAGRHVLGHRERLPGRHLGGVRRPGDHPVLPARGHRARHEGEREDARRAGRQRPVPQGHPRAGRRVAAAAGHRLHRRLLHPPLRRQVAGRGDHGRPSTTSSGRARCATSARRRCGRGSSPSCSTPPR